MQKDLRRVEVQTPSDNKSEKLEGKFHGWGVTTDNSIAVTVAMVELSDGSIIYAVPHRIRFLDNGDGDVGQKHVVKPRNKHKRRDPYMLDGSQPHPSHGGWRKFLDNCELRDKKKGVRYYGRTNCNYILFPDGMIHNNFGSAGQWLMHEIDRHGVKHVQNDLRKEYAEIHNTAIKLKEE